MKPTISTLADVPYVTSGGVRGALIGPGLIALAAHDLRNGLGWGAVFPGFATAGVAETWHASADLLIGRLDRETDLPAPARIAATLPKPGATLYVVDEKYRIRTARMIGGLGGAAFAFVPLGGFVPTIGTSGGAILNAAGELVGLVEYGTRGCATRASINADKKRRVKL